MPTEGNNTSGLPAGSADRSGGGGGIGALSESFAALELTWKNINYSIDLGRKKGKKEVRRGWEDTQGLISSKPVVTILLRLCMCCQCVRCCATKPGR